MNANYVLALVFGIGIVAGLRALTAPIAVAWAARLGWLKLGGSPLAFMGSTAAVGIFSLAAVGEFVNDLLPKTPKRTTPAPLAARIVLGGLSGACLCASAGQSLLAGAALGGIGGMIGASAHAAAKLVKNAKLVVYPGAPHGLTDTHKDKLNADLLAFLKA